MSEPRNEAMGADPGWTGAAEAGPAPSPRPPADETTSGASATADPGSGWSWSPEPPPDGPPPVDGGPDPDDDPGEDRSRRPRAEPAPYRTRRGTGFADPGLIGGQPIRIYVYIFVLILAAAADFANFYVIIQFALRDQGDLEFFGLVVSAAMLLAVTAFGFTAVVLFLAHIAGVMFRDRRARESWIPAVLPWLTLLVWIGLGVAGLYLRVTTVTAPQVQAPIIVQGQPPAPSASASPAPASPEPSPQPSPSASPPAPTDAGAGGGDDASAGLPVTTSGAAAVFLGLYVGTGLVALVGGYLTHNPAHAALRRARRQEQRASAQAAAAAEANELAQGEKERLEQLARHARLRTQMDWVELRHLGEVLKWEARLRAASSKQAPDFTDAWVPPPPGSSRGAQANGQESPSP